jgi:hypothetical protein
MSKARSAIAISMLLSGCGGTPAERGAASDWVLQRSTSAGACHVKLATAKPDLGELLATKPTRKAACQEALARKTDDATDRQGCLAYTRGAIAECAKDGIALP